MCKPQQVSLSCVFFFVQMLNCALLFDIYFHALIMPSNVLHILMHICELSIS